jgi:acetylornithine deacetylase
MSEDTTLQAVPPEHAVAARAPEVVALHRLLVETPSVSGSEELLAGRVAAWLVERGLRVERIEGSVYAECGAADANAPLVLFDSHLDTVPPAAGWTREPFRVTTDGDRVYGLGSNDAKASVAAMACAVAACARTPLPFRLGLALVEGEETRSVGTERVLAALAARGRRPAMAVLGEPTGLDIAVAQKGLLVLELVATGDACHAAHAMALGARNAARLLARDLAALDHVDLGPVHPELGPTTVEPTVLRAGEARNAIPATASAILDVRSTPALGHADIVARLRAAFAGEVRVLSDRLQPRSTALDAPLVRAARRARPEAHCFASPTLSDMALMPEVPAIKVGPGETRRSHTADEFVRIEELLAGEAFYRRLIAELAAGGAA